MSYAVADDPSTYLQQTSLGGPGPTNTTLPDTAGDITIFLWLNNLAPAVVLPAYKTILGLWTDATWMPDYVQLGIRLQIVQYAGQQCIQLALGDLSLSTVPTMSGVEKRACAVSYNGTTHEWKLRVLRPLTVTGWETAGVFTADFSGDPFTVMRALNDGIASIAGLSEGYIRIWEGVILDDAALNREVQSGVAQYRTGLLMDTPLIAHTDVTDVSGNDNGWNVISTNDETLLPGPLDAATSFLMVPDADPATGSTPTFVCAGRATTTGYPDGTVAVQRIVPATAHPTVAACFKRAGGWWQATDAPQVNAVPVVAGVPAGDVPLGIFTHAGALTETITLPQSTFDQGAIAISGVDDRIYAIVNNPVSGCDLLVYTSAGTLIATTPIVEMASNVSGYSVSVPSAGKVWVAVEGATTGLVWEYNTSGVFQSVIATLTCADTGYIQAAYGMVKIGSFLYFNSLRGGAFHAAAGIYKYDLIGGGDAVQVIAGNYTTTRIQALSVSAAGDLLVTRTVSGANDVVRRYTTAGVLQQTYTVTGTPYLIGLAGDLADNVAWVGDDANSLIVRLDLGTGATTTFSALAGGLSCTSALAAGGITGASLTELVEYDASGTILRTVALNRLVGNGAGGSHDLMELDGGDLLTIDRATGDVVRLSHVDGTIAQTYSLNVSVLDGAVNSAGTRLVFLDGTDVRAWNLTDDLDAGTLFTTANPLRCLVWLTDCSLIATTAAYLNDGPIERYTMDGTLILTYAYDPLLAFDEGQYGIVANATLNRLFVIGDWDGGQSNEQPGVLMFSLAHGDQLGTVVPLVGELSDFDVVSAIAQPVEAIMCDPFPPPVPPPEFIPIRRELVFPLMPDGDLNQRKFISRIEILVQPGIGLPGTGQGSDPHFEIQFSDGGLVYGPILTMAVGKLGDYGLPVFKNRIGYAYNPVAKLITSDPVDWQIIKCTIDVEIDESVGA